MRILRPAASAVAALALLALTACGAGGLPTPQPSGPSTVAPSPADPATPSATPTQQQDVDDEDDIRAAGVVVTSESVAVYAADGLQLFGTLYAGEVEPMIEVLTELLGDPVITTTGVSASARCRRSDTAERRARPRRSAARAAAPT